MVNQQHIFHKPISPAHQIVVRESATIDNGAARLISTTRRLLDSRQARDLDYRAHLDGAFARHGNPSGNADRLVEIVCLDEEVAAQLFARLRERRSEERRVGKERRDRWWREQSQ